MSMIAVFKLECLKIKYHLNYFTFKAKIFAKVNFAAMCKLKKL